MTLLPLWTHGLWRLSSSSDEAALALVDGLGAWAAHGPHYSRRSPGSPTFTGLGEEVVLVSLDGAAVWACVRSRGPRADRWRWRNTMFRRLGGPLASVLIRSAVDATRHFWALRYGAVPSEPLTTEVNVRAIRSTHPGYCYLRAGWTRLPQSPRHVQRQIVVLEAPRHAGAVT